MPPQLAREDKLAFSPNIYATSHPARTCALKALHAREGRDKLSPHQSSLLSVTH